MPEHTCNIDPTTADDCLTCAVERGLCTEYVMGDPSGFCRQPLSHDGPHDYDKTEDE